jgi:uncharacterized membrane protein YkvA (DUF1232 family)
MIHYLMNQPWKIGYKGFHSVNELLRAAIAKWKQSARKLKTETFALYLAYRHPHTPWFARVFSGLVIAYAFSPIDLIPDFIPILGYLDDLILVPLGIVLALKMIPPAVMAECRAQAQVAMDQGRTVNKLAALVIVFIWIGLAVLSILWAADLYRKWG